MILKKWMNVVLVGSCVMSLAACSSTHKNSMGDVNDANSAYGAQTAGVDGNAEFADGSSSSARNGRVYHFAYDSNQIQDVDRPAINANANYVAAHPSSKVTLQGHTDPRGSREYNVGLGERRAKAVAQAFDEKGVNPSQVRVVSYGAEKLASAGQTEADYQLDRRVVLVKDKS